MNYKAQATAQQIAGDLALRTGLAAAVDLSGADPIVVLGTATAGNKGIKIKVLDQRGGVDAGFDDIVGNQQPVYTGTVLAVAYERAAAGDWPISTSILITDLLNIVGDLVRRGARVELWSVANGNDPVWTKAEGTFDGNLYYPVSSRV